jgi:hypothetical protein
MNLIRKSENYFVYLAVLSYVLCTLAAFSRFPGSFSPSHNWLSDLGDITQNPDGAGFYNLGILLTGLMILLFFLGISHWNMQNRRIQNWMVRITQLFGVLGSLAFSHSTSSFQSLCISCWGPHLGSQYPPCGIFPTAQNGYWS